MNLRGKAHLIVIFALFIGCSGLSITEEKDSLGRINKRLVYVDGKLNTVEEIQYDKRSTRPVVKIFKKEKAGEFYAIREENYSYQNKVLSSITYYIYIEKRKVLSGKINYFYTGDNQPKRTEYYAITDLRRKKVFRSGIEVYTYADADPEKRRIIEYEYNKNTNRTMQLSQYVVLYENDKIVSMQTWILDKNSKNIIRNEENNLNIILEMIKNIEKSLVERTKGIKFIK